MNIVKICGYLLTLSLASVVQAEAVWQEVDGDSSNQIIRLDVSPADEPSPAFKYRLTLLPHELVPGNSVAYYMRSFPEGGLERSWKHVRDKFGEQVDDWYDADFSISVLPLDKMREASDAFNIDDHIRPGSRCRDTDWGVSYVDTKGPEVITFLLPEIQAMRSIGRAVALQTRLAIAERRYRDAIDRMRMNYRLGRDVGTQPILISGLVGIAITGMTNNNMTDLIAAPDSPNMYWALSELPRPQISLRDALRLELAIGPRMFEILNHPERQERSFEEWNALWGREATWILSEGAAYFAGGGFPSMMSVRNSEAKSFIAVGLAMASYSHAKQRLLEWGYEPERVEAMAVGQVLSIYGARVYQQLANESEKVDYVDFSAARRLGRQANEQIDNASPLGSSPDRELLPIATLLLPAVQAARSASVRIERDLDALRVLEALRMHAAQNEGQWPDSLDDVTCVPVPRNPATGEPFEYQRDGNMAVLMLPESDGLHVQRRYEMTLAP